MELPALEGQGSGAAAVALLAGHDRHPAGRQGFLDAHLRSVARPDGHGFTTANRSSTGTAYYVHDTPAVRLITLDTACPAGGVDGCLDRDQLHWLEERLIEVHSSYVDRDGAAIRTANQNRLVVILSHHPLFTLRNQPDPADNARRVLRLLPRQEQLRCPEAKQARLRCRSPHLTTAAATPASKPTCLRPGMSAKPRAGAEVGTMSAMD